MLQDASGTFYRQIKKNAMMTPSWRHFMFLGFENLKFCKTGYRLSCRQVSNLLVGSNFMEVSVRPPKTPLWCHYDIISNHCVSTLAYFIEHDIGYQPCEFQCSRMSGSNFMDGGRTPLSVLRRDKKAQCLYRVEKLTIIISKSQLKGMGRIRRFLAVALTLTVTAMWYSHYR